MSEPAPAVEPAAPVAPAVPAKPPETFAEAMRRHGGIDATTDDEPEETADGAEGETPETTEAAEPETPKVEPKKVDATPPEEAERAQFKEMAKKLGYELEGAKVTTKERAEFRESKRRHREALQQAESELMSKVQAAQGDLAQKSQRVEAIEKAHAAGDYEGLAKALGHKDWEELQGAVIAQLTDPNYKKMRELELWREEEIKRRAEEAEQAKARQLAQERQLGLQQYQQNLAKTMAGSGDQLLSTMADDPWFVASVMEIQKSQWDGTETVTPAEALDHKLPGSAVTLREQLTTVFTRLSKALGKPAEPREAETETPTPTPKPAAKPVSRTNVLPSARTEPSKPGGQRDSKEWEMMWRKRLQTAIDEERKAGIV